MADSDSGTECGFRTYDDADADDEADALVLPPPPPPWLLPGVQEPACKALLLPALLLLLACLCHGNGLLLLLDKYLGDIFLRILRGIGYFRGAGLV